MRPLKTSREEQMATVQGMLLNHMLEQLGVSLNEYFRKTRGSDRERHIFNCRHCSGVEACVHMLIGDDIDPETFCPNCKDIKRLKFN